MLSLSATVQVDDLHSTIDKIGGGKSDLGLAISLFSVGRLVGAPVLGWWCVEQHHSQKT